LIIKVLGQREDMTELSGGLSIAKLDDEGGLTLPGSQSSIPRNRSNQGSRMSSADPKTLISLVAGTHVPLLEIFGRLSCTGIEVFLQQANGAFRILCFEHLFTVNSYAR